MKTIQKVIEHLSKVEDFRESSNTQIGSRKTIGYGLKVQLDKNGKWSNTMFLKNLDLSRYMEEITQVEALKLLSLCVKKIISYLKKNIGDVYNILTSSMKVGVISFLYHSGLRLPSFFELLKQQKFGEVGFFIALTRYVRNSDGNISPISLSKRCLDSYPFFSHMFNMNEWRDFISTLPPRNNEDYTTIFKRTIKTYYSYFSKKPVVIEPSIKCENKIEKNNQKVEIPRFFFPMKIAPSLLLANITDEPNLNDPTISLIYAQI